MSDRRVARYDCNAGATASGSKCTSGSVAGAQCIRVVQLKQTSAIQVPWPQRNVKSVRLLEAHARPAALLPVNNVPAIDILAGELR